MTEEEINEKYSGLPDGVHKLEDDFFDEITILNGKVSAAGRGYGSVGEKIESIEEILLRYEEESINTDRIFNYIMDRQRCKGCLLTPNKIGIPYESKHAMIISYIYKLEEKSKGSQRI